MLIHYLYPILHAPRAFALDIAQLFPGSNVGNIYNNVYIRATSDSAIDTCTNSCCPEGSLCCGEKCYPEVKTSDTTICCGSTGFDTKLTGSDHAYCCGDSLFAYNGTNLGLNCCNSQSSSACLGNQECCANGVCVPQGTDCPAPGQNCGTNQFVCGGRCGSTTFGDTCCPTTVNGVHVMCGDGTQCCGEGCCPLDWICTEVGGCIPISSVVPSVGDFTLQGCFTDDINARVLDNSFRDPAGMTVQECIERAGSHKFAAVEYGSECYFGDTLSSSSKALDELSCNMGCSGNMTQLCGGPNAINLYQNQQFVPPSTTVAPPSTASSTASTKTPVPTLSIDQLLAVFNSLEAEIQHFNDLVKAWQDAISSGTKRSLVDRSTITTTFEAVQQERRTLILHLVGGPLPETTRTLPELEDDAMSEASEALANDEIELEEVNLLNDRVNTFNDQANEVERTFQDADTWQPNDAVAAGRAFSATNIAVTAISLVIVSLGAIFFGIHHHSGGGGGGNGGNGGAITQVITIGTSVTTITTSQSSTPTSSTTSSTSSAPACEFSVVPDLLARRITCDDSCLTDGREDVYVPLADIDDNYDGILEKRDDSIARFRSYNLRNVQCDLGWNTANAPYPPTPPSPNIPPTGAESLNIVKFLDMQLIPSNQPLGLCSWQLVQFQVRQSRTGVALNGYHTEHVFEIHFVKSFLIWILSQNLLDCSDLANTLFQAPNNDPSNEIQNMVSQITWWSIPSQIPIDNGVPRFEEFFILEARLNSMKNYILHAGDIPTGFPLATPSGLWSDVYKKLRDMSLVIDYLNRQDVSNAFESTVTRFIAYMNHLDANLPQGGLFPGAPFNSWEAAFKSWLQQFMNTRSTQQLVWRNQAVQYIQRSLAIGSQISGGVTKDQYQAMKNSFNDFITVGPLSLNAMTMRQEYTQNR